MKNNHMHNVLAIFVFFAICAIAAHLYTKARRIIKNIQRNKCKYGNVKAGDCISPRSQK